MFPPARPLYAIGDIHGRADLLASLLQLIAEDISNLPPESNPLLVFLGDYVDRGPHSREVIETVAGLQDRTGWEVIALKGNHEAVMSRFLDGADCGLEWCRHGGRETLLSYGVRIEEGGGADWEAVRAAFRDALPDGHLEFLRSLSLYAVHGRYIFVHAGLRPGIALSDQDERDLLWIRDDFFAADSWDGSVVVHGHTPTAEPYLGPHRIGVDTGAYATGALTAVRLIGDDVSILTTRERQPKEPDGGWDGTAEEPWTRMQADAGSGARLGLRVLTVAVFAALAALGVTLALGR